MKRWQPTYGGSLPEEDAANSEVTGPGWEWNELLADIRMNYRNRPRFMEILDRLEARPILQKSNARK